jgi:hypothetical protein
MLWFHVSGEFARFFIAAGPYAFRAVPVPVTNTHSRCLGWNWFYCSGGFNRLVASFQSVRSNWCSALGRDLSGCRQLFQPESSPVPNKAPMIRAFLFTSATAVTSSFLR